MSTGQSQGKRNSRAGKARAFSQSAKTGGKTISQERMNQILGFQASSSRAYTRGKQRGHKYRAAKIARATGYHNTWRS